MASQYPAKLLQFFADVERAWVSMRGFPHQGKMCGFYDPDAASGTHSDSGPFNPEFLADLRTRRGPRLQAFNAYRKSLDPNRLFYNEFLRKLLKDRPHLTLAGVAGLGSSIEIAFRPAVVVFR